ncbi:phage terminase small subunit P27 family [Azospirillum sp.]|uniref:phage terminase small subunit P27 family n=1 Tax=Azospirillum sp. TaxID=34012 RepID=UPI003D7338D7
MTRGRKPQPAEVKQAKGNPGKRRVAQTPADLPALGSTAPADLPARARKIWDELAPELARLKFLRSTDREAFARYCLHLCRWWELTKALEKKGGETYVTESAHGTMRRVDPDFLVRERIESRLETLEDRFGLSPAARQQLLQRMMSAPPPALPAGGLFGEDPAKPAGDQPVSPPKPPASPVGLLAKAQTRVH